MGMPYLYQNTIPPMESNLTDLAEQVYHNLKEHFPGIPAQRFGRMISLSLGGPVLMILTVLSEQKIYAALHIRFGVLAKLFYRKQIEEASSKAQEILQSLRSPGVEVYLRQP